MSTDNNPFQSPALEGVRGSCTSDSEVEFDYVLEDGVWFALRENSAQQTTLIRRTRIIFVFLTVLGVLFGFVGLFASSILSTMLIGVPSLTAAFVFGLRAARTKQMFQKSWRKQLGRMLGARKNTGVFGRCTIRLEEEGVSSSRPGGHAFWRWWAVPEINTAEGYLMIYVGSVEAYLVPARAFETDEHFDAFVANAMELWNAKKLSE